MNSVKITVLALALALVASGPVHAQERDRRDGDGPDHGDMRRDQSRPDQSRPDQSRSDRPHPDASRRDSRPTAPPPRVQQARGAGPEHAFHRGGRLPDQYRDRRYYVSDWRSHHLSAPPRGYQWVQTGSDFVLVAVATGIISSILLGR